MARTLRPETPVVMCSKGIEQATGKLMGDVIGEALPDCPVRRSVRSELCSRRRARIAGSAHTCVPQ